jgi:hypothetical protein
MQKFQLPETHVDTYSRIIINEQILVDASYVLLGLLAIASLLTCGNMALHMQDPKGMA